MNIFRLAIIIASLLTITSCSSFELPEGIALDETFYTQVTMQYEQRFEKGIYTTANYRDGVLLPINSEIILRKMSGREIMIEVKSSGDNIKISNSRKHSRQNIAEVFEKLFSKTKINISGFSALEKENIKIGEVAVGMSKKAVIIAVGYPPEIETPSTKSNQWTYWESRSNKFIIFFENDKVVRIKKMGKSPESKK